MLLPVQVDGRSQESFAAWHWVWAGAMLQLVVDWLGSHTLHVSLGLVPSAWNVPSIQHPLRHWPAVVQT
jgi:hypothetical protein